ncbi:MAG: SH3 domain-containing protein [Proteobacteria bacterium]|nr:SH3 domain-containing protein [Pseudomonadota bacterium]
MPAQSPSSQRQSKELEALLFKLSAPSNARIHEEFPQLDEEDVDAHEPSEAFHSLDVDMDMPGNSSSAGLDDSFFINDESGALPIPSGSFARVPSGGFRLVLDSIKSTLHTAVGRACDFVQKKRPQSAAAGSRRRAQNAAMPGESVERRRKYLAIGVTAAAVLALILILALSGGKDESGATQMAAQPMAGTNEDFEIIALAPPSTQDLVEFAFDDDDFSIPELDIFNGGEADVEAQAVMARAPQANTKPATHNSQPTAARRYGQNDNVYVANQPHQDLKLKRSCVMREGPATRFANITELKTGQTIQILAATDEDWVLELGGVWNKKGHSPKLGPGAHFADAQKGMSIPQPKSRVISANNWRYVKAGDKYGYVGPLCFK